MTLHVEGTTIYYGNLNPPFANRGTVVGWAKYDDEYHYAIRSEGTGDIITRPGKAVSDKPPEPETTLPEYVAAYIKHELDNYGSLLNLDTWVAHAFEAYEEGAR